MKKLILFLLLLATMPAMAQGELKFGYLSYNVVMQAMPEYAAMQSSMAELREKYEAEQKRVEDDFNKKYEEFLDGQKSLELPEDDSAEATERTSGDARQEHRLQEGEPASAEPGRGGSNGSHPCTSGRSA